MNKRIEFISPEEFALLIKEAKKQGDKYLETAMILGFGSGLRISEIVGFKRKFKHRTNKETKELKLIPDNTEIHPLTADKVNLEKHQIRIDDAKGGKWRIAPTSPGLKPEHLKQLPIDLNRRTLQYRFTAIAKKVLNKKMSFHILRHGFGNYCVNILKLPMPMVQQYMGHSSVAVTGIYARANPEQAINEYWKAMGG